MTDSMIILLAGLFLPLFPLSMVFNALIDKVTHVWIRAFIYLLWPLCGVFILYKFSVSVPDWLVSFALFTSFLYALRMLSLREVNQWSGFLATSLTSLLWIPFMYGTSETMLYIYALSMSLPLVLLNLLSAGLERRFGAAYTGLYGGLARTIPRFSGVLVIVIMATIATPFFPTFFIMLDLVVETISQSPFVAVVLLLIWLLWSWAGTRVIQGLIVGRASKVKVVDMNMSAIGAYGAVLSVLAVGGVYLAGVIL